jgi:exonuclease SbcD
MGRFHHGEEGDKGFLIWIVQAGNAEFEFHATPAQRTIDIVFSGPPDIEEIRRQVAACEGARVRVRYEIDEEHRQFVDRDAIREALSCAKDVQIEGKILAVQRRRAEGVSSETSIDKRLRMWGDATGTDVEALLQRLPLIQYPTQEIAEKVMERLFV